MGYFGDETTRTRLDFTRGEFTGAIGDSVTVIPLIVALALLTEVSLPHVLVGFGVFQIVWGVAYGLPISVEPMKALAALAIAGVLTYAELALAGLSLAVVLLTIGLSGTLAAVERWIGDPVIRGIQFAVGLILLETGVRLGLEDPMFGAAGIAIAGIAVAVGRREAGGLVVVVACVAIAAWTAGVPTPTLPGAPPVPDLASAIGWNAAEGAFAQLAMTVGNAALATSLIFADRFDAEVSADDLSTSMGVTNLLAVPMGAIPMCHGCDGVAGKHAFGARTGGANVLIGLGYLGAALVVTPALLAAFPLSMVGSVLAVVAVSLGRAVEESSNLALSVGIGVLALATNLGIAFLVGIAADLAVERTRR
ncbi:putative sulfate/molybdate transporter [Halorubrum cibi]|uniref:Molybdate transporter of MFS superfamily protein n=1 Tax=Halorubrum cibi TaxID=413815 RepID=A0A521CWD1_9EURY|nr:putative sulfate/molybdate transporter [Halorubrum cibi]SMO63722.1 Molybdate transporter of MFS superfamily protein [Halorubrum cibi]